jgi:hypothetical protein
MSTVGDILKSEKAIVIICQDDNKNTVIYHFNLITKVIRRHSATDVSSYSVANVVETDPSKFTAILHNSSVVYINDFNSEDLFEEVRGRYYCYLIKDEKIVMALSSNLVSLARPIPKTSQTEATTKWIEWCHGGITDTTPTGIAAFIVERWQQVKKTGENINKIMSIDI